MNDWKRMNKIFEEIQQHTFKKIKKWLQENIDADLYEYYGIKKGGIENGK